MAEVLGREDVVVEEKDRDLDDRYGGYEEDFLRVKQLTIISYDLKCLKAPTMA